jgi:protein gp37
MSYASAIEWTDTTWNPVRGCVKISPGCRNCYAETFAERFRGVAGHPYELGFDPRIVPEKIAEPLTWSRSRRVFVNSMSDLFQVGVPDNFVLRCFEVMRIADWHTYQVLTKRPERMRRFVATLPPSIRRAKHIWLGVSVENREHGVPRIKDLQATPAAIRFLSIEPLLEDLGDLEIDGIDWVIVGGESGHGARPVKERWVHSILHQCREKSIPFFFKQWGGAQKSKAGRLLDGKFYDECPAIPMRSAPPRADRIRLMDSCAL